MPKSEQKTLFDKSINPIGDLAEEAREIEERRENLQVESQKESKMTLEERHDTLKHYVDQCNKKIQVTRVLETWGQQKRNMTKAIRDSTKEIGRLERKFPNYPKEYDEYMRKEKEKIGLSPDTPLDRPSIQRAIPKATENEIIRKDKERKEE